MSSTTSHSEAADNSQLSGIVEALEKMGFYVGTVRGVSMKPLLREGIDAVEIHACSPVAQNNDNDGAPLQLGVSDVILYKVNDGTKLLLHRIVGIENGEFLVLGDNTVTLEHVQPSQIVGKMTGFWRGDRRVELSDPDYRTYVALWCKPWQIKVPLLKTRLRIKKALRGIPKSDAK